MKSQLNENEKLTWKLWPEFGQKIGLGRNSTYKGASTGEIPTIRIGGVLFVPIKKAREKFGI